MPVKAADPADAASNCTCPLSNAATTGADASNAAATEQPAAASAATSTDQTSAPAADDLSDNSQPSLTTGSPATDADRQAVVFNELLPNPAGKDTDGEFIEIRNSGDLDTDISGWSIVNEKDKKFVFPQMTIAAGGYYYFPYAQTKLQLVNTGMTLGLRDGAGDAVDSVTYPESPKEGLSYAKNDNNVWQWSALPTPGAANQFPIETTTATGDSSGVTAAGTGENSGAAAAATATTGSTDGTTASGASSSGAAPTTASGVPATADAATPAASGTTAGSTDAASVPTARSSEIIISEFLPNPKGDDDGEWIELQNIAAGTLTLNGWTLDDGPDGSKPYALTAADAIAAGGFLVLPKTLTKIALNNDGDSVRLFDPAGNMTDAVTYASAPEGKSDERTASGWNWTDEPTPGAANHQETALDQAKNSGSPAETPPTGTAAASAPATTQNAEPDPAPLTAIADLPETDDGTEVTVIGVVDLPPGRLAKTLASLQDRAGTAGIIIRFYGSVVPAMNIGETWQISGKVGHVSGELRLATSNAAAKKLSDGGTTALAASARQAGGIDDQDAGVLVSVEGLVTGRGANWLTLGDENARHEIKAVLPRGAAIGPAANGDRATARGVVRSTPNGLTLVMMKKNDLKLEPEPVAAAPNEDPVPQTTAAPQTVPRPATAFDANLGARTAMIAGLLTIPAGALAAVYVWRRRRNCAVDAN